jgi:hypothetical protein
LIYDLPESAADSGGALTTTVGSAGHVLMQDVQTGKIRTLFGVQAPVSRIEIAGSGRLIFDSFTQRNSLKEFSSAPGAPSEGHWLTRGNSTIGNPTTTRWRIGDLSSSQSGDVDLWASTDECGAQAHRSSRLGLGSVRHRRWQTSVVSPIAGAFRNLTAERRQLACQVTQDDYDAESVATVDGWVVCVRQPGASRLYKIHFDGTNQTRSWPEG